MALIVSLLITPGGKMAKILVVDDDASIRKLYQLELEEESYDVVTATNGTEALELTQSVAPDLAILDARLEAENGLDVLRRLMQIRPSLSVIINSSYTTYREHFSSWLADAYLIKSSDTSELKDKVHELLVARSNR
ncbi:MAG: two-component system response regulator [Parcubacteria group bacterium]|nr:MAG: two-component system response regulator [Parcubacteria group bacterium]